MYAAETPRGRKERLANGSLRHRAGYEDNLLTSADAEVRTKRTRRQPFCEQPDSRAADKAQSILIEWRLMADCEWRLLAPPARPTAFTVKRDSSVWRERNRRQGHHSKGRTLLTPQCTL